MPVCTWNPSDKSAGITLSGGNLVATGSGSAFNSVRATSSQSTGKWYFELKLGAGAVSGSLVGGVMTSGASITSPNVPGDTASGVGLFNNALSHQNGFTIVNAPGVTWAAADVENWAVDLTAGKVWVGKNGTYPNSGNPAAGTNPYATFTPGLILLPACASFDASNSFTANFGSTAFSTAAPSGFTGWTVSFYTILPAQGSYALTGKAAALTSHRTITAASGSYTLTGKALLGRMYGMVAATGSYALTGFTVTFTHFIAPANKLARRVQKFVLQKLRVTQPALAATAAQSPVLRKTRINQPKLGA